ncbi:hypothetical protein [Lichenihabitans psoromatis]|uniref:hypothetical protein n=1 Tax=Lichenihabitans psoromatis TaxID=2528642 RepID=UPI001035BE19|nr:hypothetical protein [Lichenihabitans psoromatis]
MSTNTASAVAYLPTYHSLSNFQPSAYIADLRLAGFDLTLLPEPNFGITYAITPRKGHGFDRTFRQVLEKHGFASRTNPDLVIRVCEALQDEQSDLLLALHGTVVKL